MAETFDVEQRWPDLFEGLTETERASVLEPLVASWHEGRVIDRAAVELLVRFVRGEVTRVEAIAIAKEAAERRAGVVAS